MRAQLLAALHGRFDAVVTTGDPTAIFTPDALTEVEQLLAFLTNAEGLDMEVLYTLGLVHWLRTVTAEDAGEQETRQLDEARAGMFLLPLFLRQPDGLPDPVRESLTAATGKPEPAPGERKHELAEAISNLAMFLLTQFVGNGVATEGGTAVVLLRQAAFDLPAGHPSYPVVLCNLGYAILLTDVVPRLSDSAQPGEPPRVDELLALFRAASHGTPPGHENYARCLNGLGNALRAKAVLTQDVATLDEAITTLRSALRATPPDAEDVADRLTALGGTIRARANDVPTLRLMLAETEVVPLERALLLGILGEALLHGETGRQHSTKVDEAVDVLREAVAGLPADSAEWTGAATNLTKATMFQAPFSERSRRRQEQHGHLMSGLRDSAGQSDPLSVVTRLLGLDAEGGDSRHAQLMDFARTVLSYPSGAGMAEVVGKALETLDKQLEHLDPQERLEAIERLATSGDDHQPRIRLWDPASLAEIEALYEQLDRELPQDDEDRRFLLLGQWQLRMVRMLDPDERPMQDRLDDMSETVTEAMGALPAMIESLGERGKMMDSMVVLGSAMMSPFRSFAIADDAVRDYRTRLAGDPEDMPTIRSLAHSLFHRYALTSDEADFQEAAGLARRVVAATSPPDPKLVLRWGHTAAVRARHTGLEGGLPAGSSGSTRLTRMSSNQAADAIEKFDSPGALETLEDGRASMLSHALNTRHEVDALRRIDPELAEEFVALEGEITAAVNPGMELSPGAVEQFQARARQWNTLVGRIKAIPGFDRFLWPLPLGLADLRPVADEGPVVTINVNPRRCDALVLGEAGLRNVPLPELHAQDVIDQADAFHTAIGVLSTGGSLTGQANRVVVDTLAWLWDVVAEPVLSAIGCVDQPAGAWSRLWWSLTGALNFLPLHAAGRHDTPGSSVIDRVVSSYTPTLRALLHSRARPVAEDRTALAVAMPETPGQPALPATVREVAAITDRMRGPAPMVGPAATREAVLAALPGAAIAHFACHASADPARPSASRLLLADGPLPITEISKLQLPGAELAYLSACATARGGLELADEAIHAASAFQLAGYAQVVATLWEVEDATAASVTARFYRELAGAISDGTPLAGALALHTVTRELRDEFRARPAMWAAYMHAGA